MASTDTNTTYTRQELGVIDILLPLAEVEIISGYKKSKIYQLIAENRFPKPVRLGKRSVRWKRSSLKSWIDSLEA